MKKLVKLAAAITMFSFAVTFLVSVVMTGQATAGNFSKTCRNISLQGATLKVDCQKTPNRPGESSSYKAASLNLDNGIGNNEGTLLWGGTNFSQSCKNLSLERWTTLKADCGKKDLIYLPSSINLDERISNIDAVLKFD
ncbi:MAG: cyanovirin [Deltaproteobacteria bacterium HGW-Deltaproteobacteria-10]|nr:MAG: cyanovirin [Deltaproteobacteria bacterium HGW-Deltaproteobacteria-10]